ncbi:MAG TPA: GNAT family N-acetyltransferase [Egicoccus sp.]|nr:GNAT family N-acetyltransferase [Egicoccus sp.]HSK21704.1 GNAT family N-acetyltransferase [Egicoccus sp.]
MRMLDVPTRPAATTQVVMLDPATAAVDWERLCQETSAAPFHRPGWHLRWADAFAPGRLRVLLGREDGRVVAALPVIVGRPLTRAPVNGHTPEFAVVAVDAASRRRLLADVVGRTSRGLVLDQLQLGEQEAAELDWALASRVRHLDLGPACQTVATDVSGSWNEFLATMRPDRRRELRRSLDRTARHGRVGLGIHRDERDLPGLLADCLAVEAAGWKGREGTAIVSHPATRRFYERMVAWAAVQGWLELRTLRLDGRLAAIQIALRHDGVLYLLKTGYDERFAVAAPGKALQHEIVRDGFADPGLSRIEWLGDEGELKRVLGTRSRTLYRLAAHPGGPAGSLTHLASSSARRSGDWARSHLPPTVRARLRAARARVQGRPPGGGHV